MSVWRSHLIVFGKAQVSSLLATAVDFSLTWFLLMISVHYIVSTALGAVMGGLINCVVNYRWTFRAQDLPLRGIFFRYSMVWLGSLLLNLWGVYLLTQLFLHYLELWTLHPEWCVMLAKTLTAVAVAVGWNYLLQRYYVFKKNNKK